MNEGIQTAIVYIDLVVTRSDAHDSRRASQGGGNLWTVLWTTTKWDSQSVIAAYLDDANLLKEVSDSLNSVIIS